MYLQPLVNLQYTRLTQFEVNLEYLLDSTSFKILTIYAEGGYRAIIQNADPEIVGSLNRLSDIYGSAAEALEALLDRTSSMVLLKLRKDDVFGASFKESPSKERESSSKTTETKSSFLPQASSSGHFYGSAEGTFGAGASETVFGSYKTSQESPPGFDQALTALPTGRLFEPTSTGSHFGHTSEVSGAPRTQFIAPNTHVPQGLFEHQPGLTVTVNLNGFPISGTRVTDQGLFGLDEFLQTTSRFKPGRFNNRKDPEDGLSGNFAHRPKKPNNDGPNNAAVTFGQTKPKPKSMFSKSSQETNSHAYFATDENLFDTLAHANSGTLATSAPFGSSSAFKAAMADSTKSASPEVFGKRLGVTLRAASTRPFVPADSTSTLTSDQPFPSSHLNPKQNPFASYKSSHIPETGSSGSGVPATGAFGNTTRPGLFPDSGVPHGSYRYNPATGTLTASERTIPQAIISNTSSKDFADSKTSKPSSFGTEPTDINKKARFHATVEDESPTTSTKDTKTNFTNKGKAKSNFGSYPTPKTSGSMFEEFTPKETNFQRPAAPTSMFGNAPVFTPSLAGQGSRFGSTPTAAAAAATTMDPASPVFTPASASASAFAASSSTPVSMFASATVPAEVAEPVDSKALAQKIAARKKAAAKSGGGLFDSVYTT
jgi:hypothetical protein